MKGYDVTFIISANLGEDAYNKIVEQFKNTITKNDGEILNLDILGQRDLATTFRKHTVGYVVHAQFNGNPKTIEEMKRQFQVNENVLRHLVVRLESVVQPAIPPRREKKERVEAR